MLLLPKHRGNSTVFLSVTWGCSPCPSCHRTPSYSEKEQELELAWQALITPHPADRSSLFLWAARAPGGCDSGWHILTCPESIIHCLPRPGL